MVQRVVSANADTPVHGPGHDEHEALGMREWRILQVEAPAFDVGEPRRDGPRATIRSAIRSPTAV
jgi:hypothetical protein